MTAHVDSMYHKARRALSRIRAEKDILSTTTAHLLYVTNVLPNLENENLICWVMAAPSTLAELQQVQDSLFRDYSEVGCEPSRDRKLALRLVVCRC